MKGVTCPVIGFTMTIRELLFCPLWAWVAWFESVAKSRPPSKPRTNAMSIAGPSGWKPPPMEVGLPKGPRISFPFLLYTRMSGVNGLFVANSPPGCSVSSLHILGRPCPGLQHVYLEIVRVAAKRDTGRGVQARGEDRCLEPHRKTDVERQRRIEKGFVVPTLRRRRRVRYDR